MKNIKNNKSIEEKIEDWTKKQLDSYGIEYFTKTETVNTEIDNALSKAPSKQGGNGKNFPDIKVFLEKEKLPIMIEVKGAKNSLVRLTENNIVFNEEKDSSKPNYTNISRYAVNGAVHYATAIVEYSSSYKKSLAIGINGYEDTNTIKYEVSVYLVTNEDVHIPIKIDNYQDLSFLSKNQIINFINKINNIKLTPKEKENKAKDYEDKVEKILNRVNQDMEDIHNVAEVYRVKLITGMIMAALDVANIPSLKIDDLKSYDDKNYNDGTIFINRIKTFLERKEIPLEKQKMIIDELTHVFINVGLWKPTNGESSLKKIYIPILNDLIPIFKSAKHLDFTGKLFNVLNSWVKLPAKSKNDTVLTPRYITEFMARLCEVNMNSYIWDWTVGSGGFLISAMKLMIEDAIIQLSKTPNEIEPKKAEIKSEHLLGIEVQSDMYMLAVLNMILMEDGSANIIYENSLKYDGNYQQGNKKGSPFPATVFLLNPPYSKPGTGRGFIFVKEAFDKMKTTLNGTLGKAAIIIQENAGSSEGLPYTKEILQNNTLRASIKMPDNLFIGRANVQTAIYYFEVGRPHKIDDKVMFVNFSNDGYKRGNRKKASQNTNLQDIGNATERYQEVLDIVLNKTKKTNHFKEDKHYFYDTISLDGDDWTFMQHIKIDPNPTEEDFYKVVKEYLLWKASAIQKGELTLEKTEDTQDIKKNFREVNLESKKKKDVKIENLFNILKTPQKLLKLNIKKDGKTPVYSSDSKNGGIFGYCNDTPSFIIDKKRPLYIIFGDHTRTMNIAYKSFCVMDNVKVLLPIMQNINEKSLLYIFTIWKKAIRNLGYARHWNVAKNSTFSLPITSQNEIDFTFMEHYIRQIEQKIIKDLKTQRQQQLDSMLKSADLKDCALTQSENEALQKWRNGDIKKKEWKLNKLFDVHPTVSYGLTNSKLFKTKGQTPVIVNSSRNNGIGGYIDLSPTEKNNIITYSDTTTSEGIFYQPQDFIGYSHVQGLYAINKNDKWSEKSLLYIITLIRKQAFGKFDYANKFTREKMGNMQLFLPVTSQNKIDFIFIEAFISAMQKLCINNIAKEKEELIDQIQKLIKN